MRSRYLTRALAISAVALSSAALVPACNSFISCEEVRRCPVEEAGGAGAGENDGIPSGGQKASSGGATSKPAGSGGKTSKPSSGSGGASEELGGAGGATDTPKNTGGAGDGSGGTSPVATGGSPATETLDCVKDADCESGDCRISYRDKDGDGYGDDGATTGRCDGTVPAGYSSIGGDCCDDGGDLDLAAQISPGQTEYFEDPALICGISWDYDCSGEVEFGGYTCTACSDPSKHTPTTKATIDGSCAFQTLGSSCTSSTFALDQIPMIESDCGTSVTVKTAYCKQSQVDPEPICGANSVAGRYIHCR